MASCGNYNRYIYIYIYILLQPGVPFTGVVEHHSIALALLSRLSRSHRTRARQGAANADLTPAQSKRQIEVHEAQRAEAKAEEQLYIDDEKFASLQEEVEEKT